MGWKIVHLTKPCKIKVKNENLVLFFSDDEDEVKVTIKDIDYIIFDNTQYSITGKSIELLSKSGVAVLFLDNEFHPSSILTPYHSHSTMSDIANIQIAITQEFKADIWQAVVQSKIFNQSEVLEFFNHDEHVTMKNIVNYVQKYDENNDEAQSARIYWKTLFKNFRREQGADDIRNSMLNYAYSLVRARMALSVSASGLLPIFGIWHKNRYNSFALVDDLIEPFRAIVDIYVKLLLDSKFSHKVGLDTEVKRELVKLLSFECVNINAGNSNISKSVDIFVKEYKRAVLKDDPTLVVYPKVNIEFFENEFI